MFPVLLESSYNKRKYKTFIQNSVCPYGVSIISKSRSGGVIALSLFKKQKNHVYFQYKYDIISDNLQVIVIWIFCEVRNKIKK